MVARRQQYYTIKQNSNLETFTNAKKMVLNTSFTRQRTAYLANLDLITIDAPIVDIIRSFSELPYCFTLQSCYGHFLVGEQQDIHNLEPLPVLDGNTSVEYRLAYIALCVENSDKGRELLEELSKIPLSDPDYIQFGSAEWFWERQINSYAVQVEPKRHMDKDKIFVDYAEALYLQEIRNQFFTEIRTLLNKSP